MAIRTPPAVLAVGVVLAALLAAACGASPPQELVGRGILGGTDTDILSVPLEDVHVDTFVAGAIPLSVIEEERLLALRDAIPPLDSPLYDPAAGGDWLRPDDLVLGYEAEDGRPYAYPIKILNLHEIVNDELAGRPVLITYCPLCRSGIVYDRDAGGRRLSFGNTSALYESDLVMYDRQTLSYWFQVGGEAIIGELTGTLLEPLPSLTTTWSAWRALHPDTVVLSRNTGFARNYDRDVGEGLQELANNGRFLFPVTEAAIDGRLPAGALVLGVAWNGERRAYPIEQLADAAINETLGGEEIVVFSSEQGPAAAAFLAEANGRALTFRLRDGRYVDVETESEWSLAGEAVAGPLTGQRLEALPVRTTFWFAYVAAFPEAEVYRP